MNLSSLSTRHKQGSSYLIRDLGVKWMAPNRACVDLTAASLRRKSTAPPTEVDEEEHRAGGSGDSPRHRRQRLTKKKTEPAATAHDTSSGRPRRQHRSPGGSPRNWWRSSIAPEDEVGCQLFVWIRMSLLVCLFWGRVTYHHPKAVSSPTLP